MIELTPEQQQALDEANGSLPVAIDPRTGETYRLVRAEACDKLNPAQSPQAGLSRTLRRHSTGIGGSPTRSSRIACQPSEPRKTRLLPSGRVPELAISVDNLSRMPELGGV